MPHPSTLRAWCKVVDGRPGFTEEAIKTKTKDSTKPVLLSSTVDEMSIRKGQVYDKTNFMVALTLTLPPWKIVIMYR